MELDEIKKPKLIESEIIDIDGERIVKYGSKSYRIKLFTGRNSYKVLTKLTKYGSGMLGGVIRGVAESEEDVDAISLLVSGSLVNAFQTIDDPMLEIASTSSSDSATPRITPPSIPLPYLVSLVNTL